MASGWISKKTRQAIYARDNNVCIYCGKTCEVGDSRTAKNPLNTATLDHIVPQKELAESAMNDAHFAQLRRDPKNLVVACNKCNSTKKHTPLYTFCKMQGIDYASILAEISRRIAIIVE